MRADTVDTSVAERLERRAPDPRSDYGALLEMQRLSWGINFPDTAFCDEAFRRSLRAGIRRGEVHVYELDGTVVAWLWLDTSTPSISGHVRHIQVCRSQWGYGLGYRIMQDAVAMCIEAHCRALTLNVTKSNVRAMALYARLGFIKHKDHGDRQFMELTLGD